MVHYRMERMDKRIPKSVYDILLIVSLTCFEICNLIECLVLMENLNHAPSTLVWINTADSWLGHAVIHANICLICRLGNHIGLAIFTAPATTARPLMLLQGQALS